MKFFSDFARFEEGCVVSFGNFDGLHKGHISLLSALSAESERLQLPSVAVTFSPHPMEVLCGKKNFRIMGFDEKISGIGELGIDNICVIPFTHSFAHIQPEEFLKLLIRSTNAKSLVVSDKCSFGKGGIGNFALLKDSSFSEKYDVVVSDTLHIRGIACSSSAIRDFIRGGKVDKVGTFLGRKYSVSERVSKGRGFASKKLSFPTANISVNKILPKFGVYLTKVGIKGVPGEFFGVTNVGFRPTFGKMETPIIETYIMDFESDIYGRELSVCFLKFLREEKRFDSIGSLSAQIREDIKESKALLNFNFDDEEDYV